MIKLKKVLQIKTNLKGQNNHKNKQKSSLNKFKSNEI